MELIAFHAIPEGIDKMPMGPITMMRNQLELPGGTKDTINQTNGLNLNLAKICNPSLI